MKRRCGRRILGFGLSGMLLLAAGCQDSITLGEITETPIEVDGVTEGTEQPTMGLLSSYHGTLVPSMRVSICSADVRRAGRDGPMVSRRVIAMFSNQAARAANGRTATIAYQLYDLDERLIQEVRCTIPHSPLAVQEFEARFSLASPSRRPLAEHFTQQSASGAEEVGFLNPDPPDHPIPIPGIGNQCGEYPDHPDCQGNGEEEEECDPWYDLNWCQCHDDPMNMVAGMGTGGSGIAGFGSDCDDWEDPDPDYDEGGGGGSNGGDGVDTEAALDDLVALNEFVLLDTIPCHLIPEWSDLAQTTVAQWILNRFPSTTLQELSTAKGAVVNLDHYTVSVNLNMLPSGIDAGGVFDHIRANLPNLTSGHDGTFSYYAPGEENRWSSAGSGPDGTYFSINLPLWFSASVVTSSFSPGSSWTFSTVSTPKNKSHPVSGHRSFTWTESGNYGTLTIRGVDRVSGPWWNIAHRIDDVLVGGDLVWQNFQHNLKNMLGPSAATTRLIPYRPDWSLLEDILSGNAGLETLQGCSA